MGLESSNMNGDGAFAPVLDNRLFQNDHRIAAFNNSLGNANLCGLEIVQLDFAQKCDWSGS